MNTHNNNIPEKILNLLEWNALREVLEKLCKTELGIQEVKDLAPLNASAISRQMQKITALKELINNNCSPDLGGFSDLTNLLRFTSKGATLSLEDLLAVKKFLVANNRTYSYLKEHKTEFPILEEEFNRLQDLRELNDLLHSSITEAGELNEKKYPVLKTLKQNIFKKKKEIEKKINALLHSKEAGTIFQETIFTSRNDRYAVLVKANMKHKCPGTVLDVSASGATFYIEPQSVMSLNNEVITLQIELGHEIEKILSQLSYEIDAHGTQLRGNQAVLAYFDFLNASALLSNKINANEIEITDQPQIKLIKVRHPILYLIDKKNIVANDVELGIDFNGLVISGANTGGKTVLLKTIGLAVILTLYGLHVPAHPDSRIGVFTSLLVDIGDDQNISQSLSTFSGQLTEINTMLSQANESTLVIIDEIMVGTNPRQGAALAQAILEQLITTNCKLVVTTHYSELKDLATTNSKFENGSVMFDLKNLKPTYQLNIGLPGISYGLEIAQNYDLPLPVIQRSRELVDSREVSTEALLEKIQEHEQEIKQEQLRISQEKERLARQKEKLHQELHKVKQEKDELKKMQGIEFLQELNEYRRQVSEKIHSLQTANLKDTGEIQESLIDIEKEVQDELKKSKTDYPTDKYFTFDPDDAEPGDKVFIISLEKEGIIETINNSRSRITVRIGNAIKSQFKAEELLVPAHKAPKQKKNNRQKVTNINEAVQKNEQIAMTVQTSYNTIDLRGMRVEEALSKLDSELHSMAQNNINTIIIIHGHGTGALREAVRQQLRQATIIKQFRPGDHGEGGDGVTIVQPY